MPPVKKVFAIHPAKKQFSFFGLQAVNSQTFFEMVCELFVSENVNKQLPAWVQPIGNFGHQGTIVFHVFKHFCDKKK